MRKKCQSSPNGFLALLSLAPSTVWPMNYPKLWFAYTLGRTDIYEPQRKRMLTPLRKLGFRPLGSPGDPQGYKGGAVWKTYHDAATFMQERGLRGYSVYFLRLKGLWEEVTYQDEGLHLLKYDAYILYPVEKSIMTAGILALFPVFLGNNILGARSTTTKETSMSETPSKKDICIDVIRMLLASELVACAGTFFSPNVSHRYYTGTLEEIVRREPPCDVCAIGALFYSKIKDTPLSLLSGRRGEPAWIDEDGSDMFAGGGKLLANTPPEERPELYRIPFTCQELALFEQAFEGDSATLTSLSPRSDVEAAIAWHNAIKVAALQVQDDDDYIERAIMLQLMANAVEHDGVPDMMDMRIRTEEEIRKLADLPAEDVLPAREDYPMYTRYKAVMLGALAFYAACAPPPCEDAWAEYEKTAHHYTLTLKKGAEWCPTLLTYNDADGNNPFVACTITQEREYESDDTCTYSSSGTCTVDDGVYGASAALYLDRDSGNVTGSITYLYANGSCAYDVLVQ